MGGQCCKPPRRKTAVGASWVGSESDNPFEQSLTKKDRTCLRESYQRLNDPKETVAVIFVDIVNDTVPELKKVFGVERVPKANMAKMPKFGGHVVRFTDFLEQMTSMLGHTENTQGAWQLVRKVGRVHTKTQFLDENQSQLERNYFAVVMENFIDRFIPYVSGEAEEPSVEGQEKSAKKVRFAQNHTPVQISEVWRRFGSIVVAQMTDAFELERTRMRNQMNQKALAPHQYVETEERKKKKLQERQTELENTASSVDPPPQRQEQMLEDPF